MVQFFAAIAVVLVPLAVVLVIGTALMEMLLRDAPRRGKRPDLRVGEKPPAPRQVCVVTGQGARLAGTPTEVVACLGRLPEGDFADIPRFVTASAAERLLLRWEAAGRIRLTFDW